ncbi:MAG: hypothetical protein H0X27_08290 [Caulobacteraceae bacterium]|nr:hypothetical protein [Caulobacteraceae bacterium]
MTAKSRIPWLMGAASLLALATPQAASGARPDVRLLSTDNKAIHRNIPVYKFARPDNTNFPVMDASSGALRETMFVDGWALIDRANCVQVGDPQPFILSTDDPNGTWSSELITARLGDGACPGVDFTFSVISFTWTRKHAPVGRKDVAVGTAVVTYIPKSYGFGRRAVITDTIIFTYNGLQ